MGIHRDAQETNISVVVRVRPRNQKEIRENSSISITTNGTRGKELHVKSTLTDASTKTYSFDKVFGPEADQDLIFGDVLAPMLKEVLMGYNCTIFAYGQTGTGKTYTMEGDLSTVKGQHAGLIPRTLYSLFDCLESNDAGEYSVRVSFTELYNEELKDLLSSEDDFRKLRIFDDYNKKGSIVIQNLEETLVKSAADVIAVLQRGSNKRQIAATKMNEVSSRSHSIFCITVHIKETTPEGEELLKVGKLNLVDLAGSENIGRSGAENRRAKEAGMINQSLLTLGRVINALVDRGAHIPYRESKLTRILQDSLGGSTKTCIIAAVSPAKCNIEETLSTLDYAHRAKNIRNKPEINQKMTKKALLRDYEDQIQRLKADLEATQSKNGVYLSPDSYATLNAENTGTKEEVEALSKAIKAVEEKYKHLNAQHEQKLELLTQTTLERDQILEESDLKRQQLEATLERLKQIQQSLSEQEFLTDAHAETEKRLDSLAAGLVVTLKSSISDVEGLHEKLARKSAIESENQHLFQDFQKSLLGQVDELDMHVGAFASASASFCAEIKREAGDFSSVHEQAHRSQNQNLTTRVEDLDTQTRNLVAEADAADSVVSQQVRDVIGLAASMKVELDKQHAISRVKQKDLFDAHRDLVTQHQQQMAEWNVAVRGKIIGLVDSAKRYVAKHQERELEARRTSEQHMQEELANLRQRNDILQKQLSEERQKGASAAQTLLASLSTLVTNYAATSDASLDGVGCFAAQCITSNASSLETMLKTSAQVAVEMDAGREAFVAEMSEAATSTEREVAAEAEAMGATVRGLAEQTGIIESSVLANLNETFNTASGFVGQVEAEQTKVTELAVQRTLQYKASVDTLHGATRDTLTAAQGIIAKAHEQSSEFCTAIINKTGQHNESTTATYAKARDRVRVAKDTVGCRQLNSDTPTGKTPKKKPFRFATSWHVTRPHNDLLTEYRENGGRLVRPSSVARTFEESLARAAEPPAAAASDPDVAMAEQHGRSPSSQASDDDDDETTLAETEATGQEEEERERERPVVVITPPVSLLGTPGRGGSKLPRTKGSSGHARGAAALRKRSDEVPPSGLENVCFARGEH
ncbi:kinesin motor protein cin8 [Thoreauomyces humboldtii]|nr:kinesin motor protein cin8 [Thoreauomyces humboldtii]